MKTPEFNNALNRIKRLLRIPMALDITKRGEEQIRFEQDLRNKIVAQNDAVQSVVDIYQIFQAGLNPLGRPVGNFLFLGPTGSGKTRLVEATSEVLFGTNKAVIRVDCGEFQHSHEIAKLIGSPPGYLGHRETHPLITQESLSAYYNERIKISLVLFDEIEKASDALWQLLLGILDKATLTLGDNRRVDLSSTMIFLTSNLGGKEISEITTSGMGFDYSKGVDDVKKRDAKVESLAGGAARKKFSAEFMNRIDKTVVFHALEKDHLQSILDLELADVQQRIINSQKTNFVFSTSERAKDFLIKEGTDVKYGARHLKGAIEKFVVHPLANLITSSQIGSPQDVIYIDHKGSNKQLSFDLYKERGV